MIWLVWFVYFIFVCFDLNNFIIFSHKQTLYESSVAFGMRKALQAEQGKEETQKKIQDLEEQKKELQAQVSALKAKCGECVAADKKN